MDWIVPFWQTLNTNAIKLINIFIPKSKSLIIIASFASSSLQYRNGNPNVGFSTLVLIIF